MNFKFQDEIPLNLTENSQTVLTHRYLMRDTDGNINETPQGLFRRVSRHMAEGDRAYGKSQAEIDALSLNFYSMLARLEFMPNSPTLMNAGRPLGQLSACFVLPVEDSLISIFDTLKHAALIHQSGGGTGFSFSRLRPRGDVVNSGMGVSSGPISFMTVYNAATEAIKQGGTRRGANMGILRIDHPDIEEFIQCKQDLKQITNFNISIAITDAFMEAVKADEPFELLHPRTQEVIKTIQARSLFNQIIENAWHSGEPGLIFIDRINSDNPTPVVGTIESTNPCGEVPLLPYEACNLGSINLGSMVSISNGKLDWEKLSETVHHAVHFLDNVITQNKYPLPEIEAQVLGNRKIGLGVMGWADLLLALNIPYNSTEATTLAREIAGWIDYQSKIKSVELAKERGAFPHFKESLYATRHWLNEKHGHRPLKKVSKSDWEALDQAIHSSGLRNATTTCIAPTGTISIICGASGGIEPLFSVVFKRQVLDGVELLEAHPLFSAWLQESANDTPQWLSKIGKVGSLSAFKDTEIPASIKALFVTAHDISPKWHIQMQEAFQEFTDNAVSKTINFPEDATRESIESAYLEAFESGIIKGITVYRDNSRQNQPMSLESHPDAFGQSSCLECD